MILLSTRSARAGYTRFALVLLVCLSQPAIAHAYALGSQGVAWRTDLGSAQAEAKARDLLLWIQFTGPWCVNCRRMERGTFVDPGIVAASRDVFIPVKLRSDEYEQLAMSLGLSVLPSTVVVKPSGEVIDKWEGYGDPAEFLEFLEETLARSGRNKKGKIIVEQVALASFCPVSLVEKRKLVPGRPTVTATRDGVVYKFADDAAKTAFLARPEKYIPANRGECPVKQVDGGVFAPGDPRFGVVYRGHLFLCAGPADRDRFLKNPERYANVDVAARSNCPHCWTPGTKLAQAPKQPVPSTATRRPLVPPPSALMEALLAPVMWLRR